MCAWKTSCSEDEGYAFQRGSHRLFERSGRGLVSLLPGGELHGYLLQYIVGQGISERNT